MGWVRSHEHEVERRAAEETARHGVVFGALRVHVDIVLPYLLHYATDEQLARIMPDFVSGETMTAIATTDPDTGSDVAGTRTTARREGDARHIENIQGKLGFTSRTQVAALLATEARIHGGSSRPF